MFELAENYINQLEENEDFKVFLQLKKEIDNKYSILIIKFKNKEALYLEAKEKPYAYNLERAQNEFIEVKKELYSKEEIIKYFNLERKIQSLINEDINEIKENISNKFTKEKNILL